MLTTKLKRIPLISIDTNAKTVKGQSEGYLTGILYMAPSDLSGYNTCGMEMLAVCKEACLNTAGLGGVYSSIQLARINKAKLYFENRELFMHNIVKDIEKLIARAKKKGFIPLVRLNGTSDIVWENVPLTVDGIEHKNIMSVFPDIQFYDYTKRANRTNLPKNYDLTFSYSGVLPYQKYVNIAMQNKMRIAVVFRSEKTIPEKFLGLNCVSGDNTDIRHIEAGNIIVALYAKGKAKKDRTGFVVDHVKQVFNLTVAN
jgi:hypothetical protein